MQIEIAFIFTQDTWEAQTVFQTCIIYAHDDTGAYTPMCVGNL